jgi:pyruvate formate lyase activating enzyme
MLQIDLSACDKCATCISVCPSDALLLTDHLEVDKQKCTVCGTCVNVCPFGALSIRGKKDE